MKYFVFATICIIFIACGFKAGPSPILDRSTLLIDSKLEEAKPSPSPQPKVR